MYVHISLYKFISENQSRGKKNCYCTMIYFSTGEQSTENYHSLLELGGFIELTYGSECHSKRLDPLYRG
jgi:hypothetical protein